MKVREQILSALYENYSISKQSISTVDSFFSNHRNPDSFQNFLNSLRIGNNLPGVISFESESTHYRLYFSDKFSPQKPSFSILPPQHSNFFEKKSILSPQIARATKTTYAASVAINFTFCVVENDEERVLFNEEAVVSFFPLIIGSKFSSLSEKENPCFGSFVFKGMDRSLINLSTLKKNYPFSKRKGMSFLLSEDNSITRYFEIDLKKASLEVQKKSLPLVILLRKLGFTDKKLFDELNELSVPGDVFLDLVKKANYELGGLTVDEYLSSFLNGEEEVEPFVDNLFASMPSLDTSEKRGNYLVFLIEKACRSTGHSDFDDLANKSIITAGFSFIEVFKNSIKKIFYEFEKDISRKSLRKTIQQRQIGLSRFFFTVKSLQNFNRFFMSGEFNRRGTVVSQVLNPTNPLDQISQFGKTVLDIEESRLDDSIRRLTPSSFGRFCLLETPDGKSIGIRRNLGVLTVISTQVPSDLAKKIVFPSLLEGEGSLKIYLDDILVGRADIKIIHQVLKKAPSFLTDFSQNIGFEVGESYIRFDTSAGRILTPYLNPNFSRKLSQLKELDLSNAKDFTKFVKSGLIVYLDSLSERVLKISRTPFIEIKECPKCKKFLDQSYQDFFLSEEFGSAQCLFCKERIQLTQISGCDFHELTFFKCLGEVASTLTFIENSPSSRNLYGLSTSKQALMNFEQKDLGPYKTHMSSLDNHFPIVYSRIVDAIPKFKPLIKSGFNLVTTYMTLNNTLYDGASVSKSALERGWGRAYEYEVYSDFSEIFGFGLKEIFGSVKEYQGVVEGLVFPQKRLQENEAIIIKLKPINVSFSENFQDISKKREVVTRASSTGEVVESVQLLKSTSGNLTVIVRTRKYSQPMKGDKISTRNGQKAIISYVVPEKSLPFSHHGISPELIIDPLSIGSRMTASSILEGKQSRILSSKGLRKGLVPFTGQGYDPDVIGEIEDSFREHLTAKRIENSPKLFVNYYLRLYHFGKNKYFFRNEGKVQILTRQPTEGRYRKGGLRLGEMERDCFFAYGAVHLIQDRFSSDMDRIQIRHCGSCKRILDSCTSEKYHTCEICGSKNISDAEIPYSVRLFLNEFMAMGVEFRVDIDDEKRIRRIEYGLLSPETILNMSKFEITSDKSYNEDGFIIPSGPMDNRFGTTSSYEKCPTCEKGIHSCTGHWAHIKLANPVLNFLFRKHVLRILQMVCSQCSRYIPKKAIKTKCPHCHESIYPIIFNEPDIQFRFIIGQLQQVIESSDIYSILQKIPTEDYKQLSIDPRNPPERMFFLVFPIPPTNIRPALITDSGTKCLNDLTTVIENIVKINQKVNNLKTFDLPELPTDKYLSFLSYLISVYLVNDNGLPSYNHISGKPIVSVSERLKGKYGRIRMNLSGKRTNNSARAVVSVDPSIPLDSVGVPEVFSSLTVEEEVTFENIERITQMIRQGGVNSIFFYGSKNKTAVIPENIEVIVEKISLGCRIIRNLRDGDIVLFNRQPSLHKHSILALKTKFIKGNNLSFHPALCYVFNADFDGDEMNIFVPQSEAAKLEAELLLSPERNCFSPKSGRTVFGIVLDVILNFYLFMDRIIPPERYAIVTRNLNFKRFPRGAINIKSIIAALLPEDFVFSHNGLKIIEKGEWTGGNLELRWLGIGGALLENLAYEFPVDFLDFIFNLYVLSSNLENLQSLSLDYPVSLYDAEMEGNVENESFKKLFQSGAKGSMFNYSQLFASVGQVYYREGVQLTNYSYSLNELGKVHPPLERCTFIKDSFFRGMNSREYLLHTISGTEGLIDRSVKTSITGYLQRKAIFAFEDLVSTNEGAVKGGINRSNLIQFHYGGLCSISPESPYDPLADLKRELGLLGSLSDSPQHDRDLLCSKFPRIENLIHSVRELEMVHCPSEVLSNILQRIEEKVLSNSIQSDLLIGIILAQSIGEPISQMTMRTFQQTTGRLLTLGFSTVVSVLETSKNLAKAKMRFRLVKSTSRKANLNFLSENKPILFSDIIEKISFDGENTRLIVNEDYPSSFSNQFGLISHEGSEVILKGDVVKKITKFLDKSFRNIKGISLLTLHEDSEKSFFFECTGSNIKHFIASDEIDPKTFEVTSIYDIYENFGIEGARSAMMYYLKGAFEQQGIEISDKHLSLATDDLCWDSFPQTILRNGRISQNTILTRAAFEQTVPLILDAAVKGINQPLVGASETFLMGQRPFFGTGATDISFLKKYEL